MQNNENSYWSSRDWKDKEKQKKIIFNSKKEFGKACFIFAVCKKRLKLGYPPPRFPSMLKYLILV